MHRDRGQVLRARQWVGNFAMLDELLWVAAEQGLNDVASLAKAAAILPSLKNIGVGR